MPPLSLAMKQVSLANQSRVQHIICNSSLWDQEDKLDGLQRLFNVLGHYRNYVSA
jgi:hypothetical protein